MRPAMAGEASFSSADAVLDDVALLEAALQDALERRRAAAAMGKSVVTAPGTMTGSPVPQSCSARSGDGSGAGAGIAGLPLPSLERYDAATAAYGVKLKSWIDFQVDQRLGQVVHSGLLQGELLSIQRESRASVERHVETEIQKVMGTQTRLLGIVQSVSEELARVQEQGHALDTVEKALEKVMVTVEELKRHIALQGLSAQDSTRSRAAEQAGGAAALLELRAEVEELCEVVRRRSDQLHNEAMQWQNECRQELAEHVKAYIDGRAEIDDLIKMMQDLEDKLVTLRADVKLEVSQELRALRAEAFPTNQGSADIERRLTARVHAEFEAAGSELLAMAATKVDIENSRREFQRDLQDYQASLREELIALQKRLVAELRAETTAAFRSESASVAALDEQLWLTDQRLGQRIDELAHAHAEWQGRRNGKEQPPPKGRALRLAEHAAVCAVEEACAVDEASAGSPQNRVDLGAATEAATNGGAKQLTMAREAAETLAEHLELRRGGTLRASVDKLGGGSGLTSGNASHAASATSLRSAVQAEDAHSQLAAAMERPVRARRDAAGSSVAGRFPFRLSEVHPMAESIEASTSTPRTASAAERLEVLRQRVRARLTATEPASASE